MDLVAICYGAYKAQAFFLAYAEHKDDGYLAQFLLDQYVMCYTLFTLFFDN